MKQIQQKIGWFFFDPNNKTVLLHRRDHRAGQSPNRWDCFGGKIENKEKPMDAFIRELYEELDITISENEARLLFENKSKSIYYIYFPDWKTRAIRLGEGAGYAWFSFKDALKLKDCTKEAHQILLKFQEKVLTKPNKKK